MTTIYFIRHGQSTANVNESVYWSTFDHIIPLADLGREQANGAGKKLHEIFKNKNLQKKLNKPETRCRFNVFCSPYLRTIQTWEEIQKELLPTFKVAKASETSTPYIDAIGEFEEAPLLREQEHKVFKDFKDSKDKKDEQIEFGKFWYRFRNAESIADVHQRVTIFLNELRLRHIQKDVGDIVVIIAHDITINMLLMNLFKKETHNYATEVGNCEVIEVATKDFIRGLTLTRHPQKKN